LRNCLVAAQSTAVSQIVVVLIYLLADLVDGEIIRAKPVFYLLPNTEPVLFDDVINSVIKQVE